MAIDPRRHLGEIIEVVGAARDQGVRGLVDRQAGVLGLQRRDLGHIGFDQLAQPVHDLGPLLGGQAGPGGEGGLGGVHRHGDLVLVAGRDLGQDLLGGGIDRLEGGLGLDVRAVDEVLDHRGPFEAGE